MDTRSKILGLDAAAAAAERARRGGRAVTLVTGWFDPVVAAHARALPPEHAARFVAIGDPPEPLLPARARAELVAGLRAVDYVVIAPAAAAEAALRPDSICHAEADDDRRRQELIRHVQSRHAAR